MLMKSLIFLAGFGVASSALASQSLWLCRAKDVDLGSGRRLSANEGMSSLGCYPSVANPIILDDKQPRFITLAYRGPGDRWSRGLSIQLRRSGDKLGATVIVDGARTEIADATGKALVFQADAPRGDGYQATGRVECEPFNYRYMFTHFGMVGIGEPASFDIPSFEAMVCAPGMRRPDLMAELESVCLNGSVAEAFQALKNSRGFSAKSTLAIENGQLTYRVDDFVCTDTKEDPSGGGDRICTDGHSVPNARKVMISNCR